MKKNPILVYGVLMSGLVLILLSIVLRNNESLKENEWLPSVIMELGVVMTSVMTLELIHLNFLREETIDDAVNKIKNELLDKLKNENIDGLRLVAGKRSGYEGFYKWIFNKDMKDLFFAGRSVLHSMNRDVLKLCNNKGLEEYILDKLKQGAQINILFIDPRDNVFNDIIQEESGNQRTNNLHNKLKQDVKESIEICEKIGNLILNYKGENLCGTINIKVSNTIPYYAYHRQGNEILIGFYHLSHVGGDSGIYITTDKITKQQFEDHFNALWILTKSDNTLISYEPNNRTDIINTDLINNLKIFCN